MVTIMEGIREETGETATDEPLERVNLCLPDPRRDVVAHAGDPGFKTLLKKTFISPENDALERMIVLKRNLRSAGTQEFWTILMREMTAIMGAQCGFAAKRILFDDENSAIEMPPLGEPGSCLMGTAFYLNGGTEKDKMMHDYRYLAHESPCAHMRHDKVFIIPEKMSDFVRNTPNKLPWEKSEAFLGIPIFSDGKCFGHFGCIWSAEGAANRKLSWAFLEMFAHSLEDMITDRLLQGKSFAKKNGPTLSKVIPAEAITTSQSLKPYARSLSHELRTPMQGVVGMLDIMQSNVSEAIEIADNDDVKHVFAELMSNIQRAQDSSKRAVEAADNVVHAYDLNMQMPDTPASIDSEVDWQREHEVPSDQAVLPIDGPRDVRDLYKDPAPPVAEEFEMSMTASNHKRSRRDSVSDFYGPPVKRHPVATEDDDHHIFSFRDALSEEGIASRDFGTPVPGASGESNDMPLFSPDLMEDSPTFTPIPPPFTTNLGTDHRHFRPRQFMIEIVAQAIKGFYPVEETKIDVKEDDSWGEITYLKLKGPRGDIDELTIQVTVSHRVPTRIITKVENLRWILAKMVDNALKFTPRGEVLIDMRISRSGQFIEVWIGDTGCGISEESKEHIFVPHWQEDATNTRQVDGLGLGLFNAKARTRQELHGDITLERSDTEGPHKGSMFLVRFPHIVAPPNIKYPHLSATSMSPSWARVNRQGPRVDGRNALSINGVNASEFAISLNNIDTKPTMKLKLPANKRPDFDRELVTKLPVRILIAEDNLVNRVILAGFLYKLGYTKDDILLSFNGLEAVEEFRKSLEPGARKIDVILMDLWMPLMNGYDATVEIYNICREQGTDRPAVFAVTADITSDSQERSKATEMSGWIPKPFKVADIEKKLVNHFLRGNDEHSSQHSDASWATHARL